MNRNQVGVSDGSAPLTAPTYDGGAKIADVEAIVRQGFVRKVYGILFVQLLVTFGCIFGFTMAASYGPTAVKQSLSFDGSRCGDHCNTAMILMWTGYGVSIAAMLVLLCCLNGARQYPTNMIVLAIFTLGESLFLAVISAQYTAWSVCLATGTTVIVVGVLTLFACTTKIDFTGVGMYLYVSLMCLSLFGFIGIFFVVGTSYKAAQYYQLGYASIGCLIFSLYLVYDTQLIMGGKHKKFQFTVDDYVFAALNIYLDIVQLFIYILQILGERR